MKKQLEEQIQNMIHTSDGKLVNQQEFKNQFIQLVFQNDKGEYTSYFLDYKNGNPLQIEEFIKEERLEHFKETIKNLISLKYPSFIADVLNYGNGQITYVLNETNMTLYFYHFPIQPMPQEELSLKIDFNEIKDDVIFPVKLQEEYENENGFHYIKEKKTIALTFDDGPSGSKTIRLMELLAQNKMHATFFMVGNRMGSSPDILQKLLQNGNEIGSHSYNHVNLTRLTKENLLEEENKTNQIFKSITGKDLKLIRAPYGSVNNLMKENLNYIFVNWNLDTEDWRYRNAEHIYQSVIENASDGDIILMHDLYESTVAAVEKLLPELYVRGFQVVSISELANLKGITLEPHQVYRSIK